MKKKTVITTEKHEVWVIRRSSDQPANTDSASRQSVCRLTALPEQHGESEPSSEAADNDESPERTKAANGQ